MAQEQGFVPPALKNRPSLQTFDIEIWNAFNRLSARRSIGGFGAVGAIPYIEIISYLKHVAKISDPDEKAVFIELIETLDETFLKDFAEKQKKEEAKKPKSGSRNKPTR